MGKMSLKCGRCDCPQRYSCRMYDISARGDFMVKSRGRQDFKCRNKVELDEPMPEIKPISPVDTDEIIHFLKLGAGSMTACGKSIHNHGIKYTFGKKEVTCEKCFYAQQKLIKLEK